jgi:type IV pilus biogenesis protein PilP
MAQGIGAEASAPALRSMPKVPSVAAPQGVPFPSMEKEVKLPEVPLSTKPMAVDPAQVGDSMHRLEGQVDNRLDNTQLGSGNLAPPDMGPIQGELSAMAEEQRQIRILTLKQQHADVAFKLWSTLYDPRKEEEARRKAAEAVALASAPKPVAPVAVAPPVSAGPQFAPVGAPSVQPFPKIVSIGGTPGAYRAELLVPYVGEVDATPGTRLPAGRRVSRIGPDGVYVRDAKLGEIELGFGDSVPLLPPDAATVAAPKAPDMLRPPGIPSVLAPQGYAPAQTPPQLP